LRGRQLGEADRIFTLFSTERGKMDAVAKGVRRTKSHLAGRLEFGNECALGMHRGRSLDVIVSAEIKQSPWTKLVEPERFAVASLVAELIDAFCEPDLPLPDVYELLVGMLGAVASSDAPCALLPRFSLRLLSALGIEPPVTHCVRCGRAFTGDHAFVDADSGGFICETCRERWRDLEELDADDLANLASLAAPRGDARAVLSARPRVASAMEAIITHHLGRRPKAGVAVVEFVTPEA
jgi:DNA repair protein RecO (recombination protein O)